MRILNQLKKKLHLNKLIQLLKQYKYIVFYHSKQGSVLRYDGSVTTGSGATHGPGKVFFLVNSARIGRLSNPQLNTNHSYTMHNALASIISKHNPSRKGSLSPLESPWEVNAQSSKKTPPRAVNKENREEGYTDHMKNFPPHANPLSKVALGGVIGNCYLVGCESLEQMQKVIKDNNPISNTKTRVDAVCLGAIGYNSLEDHLDCQHLSGLNPTIKRAQEEMVRTLGRVQNKLLSVHLQPLNHMQITLMAARGHHE